MNLFVVSLISLVIGIGSTYIYFRTPVTENGIDFDGDGIPDEWWFYKGERLSEARVDRNLDKAIDLYYYYDHEGLLKSTKADDDFDGVFESETKFKNNNAIWTKSDTTGDGYKNYQMKFSDGVVDAISFWDAQTKKIIKVDYYKGIQLSHSQIDTNGDGVLDTMHNYDEFENVIKTSKLK